MKLKHLLLKHQSRLNFKGLFLVLLFFAIYSCTHEDLPNELDNNSQNLSARVNQNIKGVFYMTIADSFTDKQVSEDVHEAFIENKETGLSKRVEIDPDQVREYLKYSGRYVEINASDNGSTLRASSIRQMDNDISFRGGPKGGGQGNGTNMLIVMVSDAVNAPSCTAEDMEYQVIGSNNSKSTANLYTASSFGKFTINSVTTTSVVIDEVVCSLYSLRSKVNPILENTGFSPTSYDYIMYVTASICSYGGVATLNGQSFQNASCTWKVVTPHELGHCLGLNHSGAWGANNSMNFYGDPSCFMGVAFREMNALHRDELGWIGNKNKKSIKNAGTYILDALENQSPGNAQLLKVDVGRISTQISSGGTVFQFPENYYLSYRAPLGEFDPGLSVADRLSIHTWSGDVGEADLTRFLTSLGTGEEFIDNENGVKFTNQGIVNGQMSVAIEFF